MDKEEAKRILEKAAIRARDTNVPSNGKSLTLEQLREMDGMPVWLVLIDDPASCEWMIVYAKQRCCEGRRFIVDFCNIGTLWLAYACPPERIDREKWEPCEWCGSFGKTSDNWACTLEDDDGHTVTNNHIVVCATANYCPSCGRPITEQAWAELERRING